VTEGWRILHNKHDVVGWGCSTHWESNAYRIFVGKSEGKIPLVKSIRTCEENNIKMDLREIGWSGMDCINLAKDRDQ
jgi:hypothetical protein